MITRPRAGFAGKVQVGEGGWPKPCPAGKSIDGLAAGERDHRRSEASDVVTGNNNVNGAGGTAYDAVPGWDAATGWGSIIGTVLQQASTAPAAPAGAAPAPSTPGTPGSTADPNPAPGGAGMP